MPAGGEGVRGGGDDSRVENGAGMDVGEGDGHGRGGGGGRRGGHGGVNYGGGQSQGRGGHGGGLGAKHHYGRGMKAKNSVLKELTVRQMNDLIEKNRGLKADLIDAKKKVGDLNAVQRELNEMGDEKEVLEKNLKDLRRRLGSREYLQRVAKNVDDILDSLEEDTQDVFEQIVDFEFTDNEAIKLAIAIVEHTSPGAKLAFINTLLAIESPSIRASVICDLGKLVESDRLKSKFVKEVLPDNNCTPVREQVFELPGTPSKNKPLGSTVQHDPSAATMSVEEFYCDENREARVVTVKGTYFLACSTDDRFVTKHTAILDAQGRKVKTTCVGCGVVYVDGVTDIAPCIVVGPEYRDDIGQKPWVCLEHWRHSINRVQVDEVTLDTAAIEQESLQFIEGSPVIHSKTTKYKLKRKLDFPDEGDFALKGVKVVASGSGVAKAVKAVAAKAVKGDDAAKAAVVKDGADAKPTAGKGGGRPTATAARAVVAAMPRAKSVKAAGAGAGKGKDDGSSADDFE